MRRNMGLFVGITGGMLVILLAACDKFFSRASDDQGPPDGISAAQIASKCRKMDFDTTPANSSEIKDIKNDGTVMVRIFAAKQSVKTKVKDLASKKGRIIGKAVNYGTAEWRLMALAPSDTSCWHAWMDDKGIVHAQWVGLTNEGGKDYIVQLDDGFGIKFHEGGHTTDKAQWNPPGEEARSDREDIFRLASAEPEQVFRSGNVGWTTCLVSGCCRSRQ
jgi:hypothetical protein